jgi:hypothetical protein
MELSFKESAVSIFDQRNNGKRQIKLRNDFKTTPIPNSARLNHTPTGSHGYILRAQYPEQDTVWVISHPLS